jgi:uncharacterized protein YutE (UPF0331/DUF86 family)/predicted nucleotidyltransferase
MLLGEFMVHNQEFVKKIGDVVKGFRDVKLAYLYGSYAWGNPGPASDIDIAVVISNRAVIPTLAAEIAKALDAPEDKVSIVDIGLLDEALRLKIIAHGIKLVDSGSNVNVLLPRAFELVEVLEDEKFSSISWLRGNPVDLEVVRSIAAAILEDSRDLKELLDVGFERVVSDKHVKKSFERTFYTLIESMIDILRHVMAGLNLGVASYYRDYIDICLRNNIISMNVAERVLRLIPVRHALVHRYRRLNYEELWKEAEEAYNTAKVLVTEVREYLKMELKIEL